MKTKLLLFTDYFPYGTGAEYAFLKEELVHLRSVFEDITIVPGNILDKKTADMNGVEVDTSYALNIRNRRYSIFFSLLLKKCFYQELLNRGLRKGRLKRLINFSLKAWYSEKWILEKLKNKGDYLIYTYWNSPATLGAILYNSKIDNKSVVTRVHGHDLFEERMGKYIPYISYVFKNIDKIIVASDAASMYILKKHSDYFHKVFLSKIGVSRKIIKPFIADKEIIRIISCSNLIPLKRVNLILEGIDYFIKKYNLNAYWHHIGDGKEKIKILERIEQLNNSKLQADFVGYQTNDSVLEYYSNTTQDIFITTTSSEGGIPVSIQEAQSFGIPVLGTNVGGVPEIVNDKVGGLLSDNPTPEEIADALYYVISNKERHLRMREESLKNWERNFDESINYKKFVQELLEILK